MNYTPLILMALGMFGVLIHNLVKLNELNKNNTGTLTLAKYLSAEKYAILISICVVIVALLVRAEIKQLEAVGNWLGLAFVAIGYMAQSLVVSVMGKAQKIIEK